MRRMRTRLAVLLGVAAAVLTVVSPLHAGVGAFTTQLSGRTFNHIAVDPANPKVVYAAGSDTSMNTYLFKSVDSGSTWAATGTGLGQFVVFALAVGKANDSIVYIGGYNFNSHTGALYQSTNAGTSFTQVASNLGDNSVQAIEIDPTNASVSYVGLNHGLAKSSDGTTWSMLPGMVNNNVQSLAIDHSPVPVLYAGTNATSNPGVWKSMDGGQTWTVINNGLPAGSVLYLAVDVTINSTLYAGVANAPDQPFQLLKTTNAGQQWTSLRQTDPMTALVVDSQNGLNVYYETQNSVFGSGDGGTTWKQIYTSGGGALGVDGLNPQTYYVGASNGLLTYTAPPALLPTPTPAPLPSPGTTPLGSGASFTFPQTGHTVSGIWLDFLKTHGDVDNLGYPRTEVIADPANNSQTAQYFQRLVLEYHPEQQAPYQIQRRLLGDILYPGVDPAVDPAANRPSGDAVYFPNTVGRGSGHFVANVAPDGSPTLFKQYFDTHGKEDAFGYPKEEPKQRQLADGQMHWTQRFQSAVFEYHGENDKAGLNPSGVPWRNFRVQLELLGDEYIAKNNLPFK
jgi:photosystem II stability/assembly factor-like uncharacterized protein